MWWEAMNRQLDLCDVWDLTLPTHPVHSRLYALEPLGVGTPHIESLTSYLARLAEAHCVSLRTLVKQELLSLLKRDYLSNPFGNSLDAFWIEAARALNGTGALAKDWVGSLEQLTLRTDLRFLTLLPWAAVLTQQRLLRLTRAWCPDCFMEWQNAGQPIYEPLLWNLNIVSVCLRHQRTLLERCPYPDCHATLPVLASFLHPGYCSKCSRWLGIMTDSSKTSRTNDQWHWQVWVAEMVGELLSHNKNIEAAPHLGNVSSLVAAAREQVAEGSMEKLEKRLQLSRRTVNAWCAGRQIPQLESLLRLCYCCGVSPYSMFTLPSGTLHLHKLKVHVLPDIPSLNGNRRQRIPMDRVYIQQRLEKILTQEEQPPPSMRTVAKCLNHSPRELREHFPELNRAIANRRKQYYQVRREQRLLQLKEEMRQTILKIHAQGLYPSSHRVGRLMSTPAVMRDRAVAKFWREILEQLKLTGKLTD
jgi:transcriptional regulator with XRE-family HTH domain